MSQYHISTEQELIDAAVGRMAKHKRVFTGVPSLSRCIDVVVLSDERVIALEFKLRDWKRALTQAKDHLLAADKAYVCFPSHKSVSAEMLTMFSEAGVGLLLFEVDRDDIWPFNEVVPAPWSNQTWSVARSWLISYLDKCGAREVDTN